MNSWWIPYKGYPDLRSRSTIKDGVQHEDQLKFDFSGEDKRDLRDPETVGAARLSRRKRKNAARS